MLGRVLYGLGRPIDGLGEIREISDRIVQAAYAEGMLLLGCGKSGIRFMPGLVINADEVDEALERFGRALAASV